MARQAFRRRVRPLREWLPMTFEAPRRPKPVKERERCDATRSSWISRLAALPAWPWA